MTYPSSVTHDVAGSGIFNQFGSEFHDVTDATQATAQQSVDKTLAEQQSESHLSTAQYNITVIAATTRRALGRAHYLRHSCSDGSR